MVELSDKQLRDWKALFDKEGVKYESDDDVNDMVNSLVGYFDVLIQMDLGAKEKAKQADSE